MRVTAHKARELGWLRTHSPVKWVMSAGYIYCCEAGLVAYPGECIWHWHEEWEERLRLDQSPTSLSTGGSVIESDQSLEGLDERLESNRFFTGVLWGCGISLAIIFVLAFILWLTT